jgi:hypothetical protein
VVGRAKALEEIKQSFEYLHKNESFKWNDILDYFLKKELNGVTGDFSVRDFTKQIASLNRLKTNKERVDVLKQIIADKNFSKLEYHSGKRSIFAMGMKDYDKKLKENEMPTNLTLAKKFVQNGYNVYLMPNPHKLKSADFIIEKEGKLLYVEGKTLNGKNSLDHRLDSAAKQSRIAAIDVIGTNNASYIGKEIKAAFINNESLDEIILFKRGRIIRINRKKALDNGFEKDFRKQWNKQK